MEAYVSIRLLFRNSPLPTVALYLKNDVIRIIVNPDVQFPRN